MENELAKIILSSSSFFHFTLISQLLALSLIGHCQDYLSDTENERKIRTLPVLLSNVLPFEKLIPPSLFRSSSSTPSTLSLLYHYLRHPRIPTASPPSLPNFSTSSLMKHTPPILPSSVQSRLTSLPSGGAEGIGRSDSRAMSNSHLSQTTSARPPSKSSDPSP